MSINLSEYTGPTSGPYFVQFTRTVRVQCINFGVITPDVPINEGSRFANVHIDVKQGFAIGKIMSTYDLPIDALEYWDDTANCWLSVLTLIAGVKPEYHIIDVTTTEIL